jgi:hypothetical protein
MDPSKEPVDKKWCGVRELDAGKGTAIWTVIMDTTGIPAEHTQSVFQLECE